MLTVETMGLKVERLVNEKFPNSFFSTEISTLGGVSRPSLIFRFALGKDSSEWKNGIVHNDPCHTIFFIHGKIIDGEYTNLELNSNVHGYTNKNWKHDKLGWRNLNKNVTDESILKLLNKYFTKMEEKINE